MVGGRRWWWRGPGSFRGFGRPYLSPVACHELAPLSPGSVHIVVDPDDHDLLVGQQITLDRLSERESMQHRAKDGLVVHRGNLDAELSGLAAHARAR